MCVEERIFVYALFFLLFYVTNINYKEGCDIEGWNFIQLQKIMFSHIFCFEFNVQPTHVVVSHLLACSRYAHTRFDSGSHRADI